MSLAEVHHQGSAQRRVQQAVERDRVPHAYLFHGPDGVGKEKLAIALAQLLLCENPVDRTLGGGGSNTIGVEAMRDGCGTCEPCRCVRAGTHPDLHLIYRQLSREHPELKIRKLRPLTIGIDVVRHFVINAVGLTPTLRRGKVFVIREADRITPPAQNALLKTLEEPPGGTVLILLVTAIDRLLPTTLSRCQVVAFDALPTEFVRSRLVDSGRGLPDEQASWYAQISAGSLGRAVEHADDGLFAVNARLMQAMGSIVPIDGGEPVSLGALTKMWIDESKAMGELHRGRDADITDTEASRRGLRSIFQLASTWYADLIRLNSEAGSAIVNASRLSELESSSAAVGADAAISAVNRLAEAERQLDLNVNTQLCVEVVVNDLAHLARDRTPSVV